MLLGEEYDPADFTDLVVHVLDDWLCSPSSGEEFDFALRLVL